jgi:hypothetical protein
LDGCESGDRRTPLLRQLAQGSIAPPETNASPVSASATTQGPGSPDPETIPHVPDAIAPVLAAVQSGSVRA